VVLGVLMAVLEVVGFLHWWDVTISGVSTIYILISVGLTVDYSAHVAHMFVVSGGSADERAIAALTRIGPSVFNAVASTLVAVVVLSTSASFVFRIFFKALCLTVVLGGAHGLILLPVLLALFGGKATSTAVAAEPHEDGKGGKSADAVPEAVPSAAQPAHA
jgi:predicted RND superfamily exporter protein